MKNKGLLFFLTAASALALFAFTGCTSNRIETMTINLPKSADPATTFGVQVRQSGYKAAQGDNARVEATNDVDAKASGI